MIYWVIVKKKNLMNKRKKKLNATLECHMVGLHVLSYEVSGKKKKSEKQITQYFIS